MKNLCALGALVMLLSFTPFCLASGFYQYPLIDLQSHKQLHHSIGNKASAVIFYEPNCSWCFKQTKVLNRFLKDCQHQLEVVGIGVNGTRAQLKKEAWRLKAQFPLYMASPELLEATGQIKATPLILLLNQEQKLVASVRGYVDFAKWQGFLKTYQQTIHCPAS